MEQGAYRPTLRPAKPDATPKLTDDERDALEHRIKCQCGCILDIYTCRTTDFTCQVSPAMHRDVLRLVAGGYDATEILAAFVETYGEVALTEPKKEGFNWAGYFAPSVAMATGAVLLTVLLRKWSVETRAAAAARSTAAGAPAPAASDDDLARLERALREDA
jgi:cytochrome c-type biogenesis protein CcmH